MRVNSISLGIKVRVQQYEMLDLMATFTPNDDMTLDQAYLEADKQLRDAAQTIIAERLKQNPAPAAPAPAAAPAQTAPAAGEQKKEEKPKDQQFDHEFCEHWEIPAEVVAELKKETDPNGAQKMAVNAESKNLQKVVKRIEAGIELNVALQWIAPDETAFKVLALAAKLNERK